MVVQEVLVGARVVDNPLAPATRVDASLLLMGRQTWTVILKWLKVVLTAELQTT